MSMILNKWFNKYTFITVPGLGGSGSKHWHSFWERQYPKMVRVEQAYWDNPEKTTWVKNFVDVLNAHTEKPIVLIGHSLGCGTIIHALNENKFKNLAAIFLVALPDIDREDFPEVCVGFSPMPTIHLPVHGALVASEDDRYCSMKKSLELAMSLRCPLLNVGNKDHIGTEAELNFWPEGQMLLDEFLTAINE